MSQTASQFLAQFVLEQIATQPPPKRIMLYRAFALETKDLHAEQECRAMATELETLEKQHQSLVRHFQEKGINFPNAN